MKKILTLMVSLVGVIFLPTDAVAQENEGCFMVSSSGKVVSLADLCGTANTAPTNPKVFQAAIKRRASGIPVIDVTFNGKQKFEMLLDTGASQTTITQAMADALGVVPVGTEKSLVANGAIVESPFGRVASIAVGGATVTAPTVSIAPVPLLGQNFFGDYDVIIRRDLVEFHAR